MSELVEIFGKITGLERVKRNSPNGSPQWNVTVEVSGQYDHRAGIGLAFAGVPVTYAVLRTEPDAACNYDIANEENRNVPLRIWLTRQGRRIVRFEREGEQ